MLSGQPLALRPISEDYLHAPQTAAEMRKNPSAARGEARSASSPSLLLMETLHNADQMPPRRSCSSLSG